MDTLPTLSVNGQFVSASQPQIAHTDRSFRFGDGFFQTIAVVSGVPYQWEFHCAQLEKATQLSQIPLPNSLTEWVKALLIHASPSTEGALRITVSRGSGSRGYYPIDCATNVIMEFHPIVFPATASKLRLCVSTYRRFPASYLDGSLKWNIGLNNTLALLEASQQNCDNALQLSYDGMLCEAASANLFWLKNQVLYTPSLYTNCLRGSTREAVMRLSPWPVHEVEKSPETLADAEAVWLSNSRYLIAEVTAITPLGFEYAPIENPLFSLLQTDRIQYAQQHHSLWKH